MNKIIQYISRIINPKAINFICRVVRYRIIRGKKGNKDAATINIKIKWG